MVLGCLNERGVEEFRSFLGRLRENPLTPLPRELLDNPSCVTPMGIDAPELPRSFSSKFDAGRFLHELLLPLGEKVVRSQTGLWTWLSLWLFDHLCPPDRNGLRKPKRTALYIASPSDHRMGLDKHLLFFPWKMYSRHGRDADFILAAPLGADSTEQREWTSYRLNLVTELLILSRELHWDGDRQGFKRGARTKGAEGGIRRFVQLFKQLEVTYDIYSMSADQLRRLLPPHEYARWM